WYFTDAAKGVLKLFSVPVSDDYKNLWDVPNLLLQKFPAQEFKVETKVAFFPNPRIKGEKAGLVVMGLDYAALSIESTDKGLILSQITCIDAENGKPETINESVNLSSSTVYLAVSVSKGAICTFSYSVDGKKYRTLGKPFTAKEGKWIGAKVGYFCTRPVKNNDGGRLEADWFRIKK
ncbi:MAG: glycoside hydrolase, partial [Dysgonamonadaceae bacterium]|nr:glycoside hydrolase [Dysgonamonadaceae bacterium]